MNQPGASGITVTTNKITIDDQGRVVIDDPNLAATVQEVLNSSDPNDAGVGNMVAMDNTQCVNAVALC